MATMKDSPQLAKSTMPMKALLSIALGWLLHSCYAFSTVGSTPPAKIVVTGAAGRTGKLVFSKLLLDERYAPIALVRTESSAKKLHKETKCGLDHVIVCDVTNIFPDDSISELSNAQAMIICTSAVPIISKRSLMRAFLKIPFNLVRGRKAVDFRSLKFNFRRNQYPEKVDYEGQLAQIDLAKRMGFPHAVIVSSMGGTDPSNFLNSVGKNKDGSGNGDILLWKRKAERYLVESGLRYTIIHPGGLVDNPDGLEELVLDVDDKLLENKKRSISRGDVANLCVSSLSTEQSVSFDCITRPAGEGDAVPTADESLAKFLELQKTTNYAL